MISINVQKRLSAQFLLDVAFDAKPGFMVLGGASGAGKTTVLRLIAGSMTPDSGVIRIGQQIAFDSDSKTNVPIQNRHVGFVFQDYALFPHLTGVQNVMFGMRGPDRSARRTRAAEYLSQFRVEHLAERRPRDMSGGEQQRIALARALASDPNIMLLDEPLSAIDVETRFKLLDEIKAAQQRSNVPFIYVTHQQTEAEKLGGFNVILENGRVANPR